MKKKILDLNIEEFVRTLCNMEKVYTLNIKYFPKAQNEEDDEIKGTYSQIHGLFMDMLASGQDNKFVQGCLKQIEENLFDYEMEICDLDIYDYLEERTKGFQKERCQILLNELEMFHCMYINEERLAYVNKKIENGWNEYEVIEKISPIDKQPYKTIDYKDAYKKIYGYAYDFFYYNAINVLKNKIEQDRSDNSNLTLPAELDNERAKKYFAKAIQVGYMKKSHSGYQWIYGGNKGQVRLGYFCYKVFNTPRPINKLERLFGITKLSASISSAENEPQRADVKQWRKEIDDNIFKD